MVEEIFENCVCETLHIGINSPIQSFTMVEKFFKLSSTMAKDQIGKLMAI